jgi:proline iminopeptidase
MIPIETPVGKFNVWTKRFGNNPKIKVLLLHGGPGGTHEFFESFESFFPQEGIEFYEYDQLGSYFSDQPKDSSLWTTEHFVEEVEQVRKALGLNKDNFYLLGHSWGGILAMEYALKYQDNLKGLVISNMMSSCPLPMENMQKTYWPNKWIRKYWIRSGPLKRGAILQSKIYGTADAEFLRLNIYAVVKSLARTLQRAMPHLNAEIYTMMQGPSEFGVGGRLANGTAAKIFPK